MQNFKMSISKPISQTDIMVKKTSSFDHDIVPIQIQFLKLFWSMKHNDLKTFSD